MAYGSNILKKEAAYYSLVNATIINGILHIGAGGSATQILSVSDLPAVTKNMLFTCISDNEYSNHYVPDIQVIVYTKMNSDVTYSKAILYPVQVAPNKYSCEFTMEEGSYDEMYVTLKAQKSVNLTLWELCAEAADESAIVEIEGVKQSLAKLLYDYNTWPLQVDEYEQTIGVITCRLLDNTDIQGHFSMTGMASESAILTLRFYDNEAEELFAPLEYDIRVGYNSVGVPHSYLDRLAGIHSFTVTAQVTTGTIDIDTRGILFTIDGGYLAAREITVGMDVCDLAIKQTSINSSPEEIWLIGIDEGEAFIRKRSYSDQNTNVGFKPVSSLGKALDAAIEFDGSWVLRTGAEKFTIETDDQPWIFWISDEITRTLYAQKGDDETTRFVAAEGVKSVHACKGYSSEMYPEQDQGLVLLYVKTDGSVFYRQYTLNTETKTKIWSNETEIGKGTEWLEANVHRLNDYRLSFELTSASENHWMITERTYVGQSVYPENADFNGNNKIGISMFRNGDVIDFTGKAVLFDDPVAPEKVFRIRYPYDIKAFDSSYKSAVTVTLNGKKLSGNSYTLSFDGTDLVITTKDEVAATRAEEAVLQVDISAKDTPFYLSNGNSVNRLLLYDQSFSWIIERDITVKNIKIEETVGIHIAATSAITIQQVQNQASIQPDEGTLHTAMTSSFITRQVKETKMSISDEGELKASVTAEIKTYMTGDAPI